MGKGSRVHGSGEGFHADWFVNADEFWVLEVRTHASLHAGLIPGALRSAAALQHVEHGPESPLCSPHAYTHELALDPRCHDCMMLPVRHALPAAVLVPVNAIVILVKLLFG